MLAAEDRFAIQDLYARYYWANDTGDADGWADAFHEGAVLHHDSRLIEGRAEILDYARDRFAARGDETTGQHFVTNLLIEGGPDVALGRCYFMRLARDRDSGTWQVRTAGWYEDELRKLDGRWGFTQRRASHEIPAAVPGR